MKIRNLSALFVLVASPFALLASHETDRKIEEAAKASYNYRTVLEDHVKVKASDGVVVHITGDAASDAEKTLVTKLAQDVRGTKSVINKMTVKA